MDAIHVNMPLEQAGSRIEAGSSIGACGWCGKTRQFNENPAENYPQWVITSNRGYCSEGCRIDGEAAAAQAKAEGEALG